MWIERELLGRWPTVWYFWCKILSWCNPLRYGSSKVFLYQGGGLGWQLFYWCARLSGSSTVLGWSSRRVHSNPEEFGFSNLYDATASLTKKRTKKSKSWRWAVGKVPSIKRWVAKQDKNFYCIPVQHTKYRSWVGSICTIKAICCWSGSHASCFWDGL